MRCGNSHSPHWGIELWYYDIYHHNGFNKDTLDNNIAIVILKYKLKFGRYTLNDQKINLGKALLAKEDEILAYGTRVFFSAWCDTTSIDKVPIADEFKRENDEMKKEKREMKKENVTMKAKKQTLFAYSIIQSHIRNCDRWYDPFRSLPRDDHIVVCTTFMGNKVDCPENRGG